MIACDEFDHFRHRESRGNQPVSSPHLAMSIQQRLLVVGGNGFVGSAVCKQALSRGWEVISISGSGRPFRTPRGHAPTWTTSDKMQWHKADAFDKDAYRDLAASCTAAVHTVGILMESNYKGQQGSSMGAVRGLMKGWGLASSNPLASDGQEAITYERMNRDAAITVAETFKEAHASTESDNPLPFVVMSAADIMRPLISARYTSTKYEAEQYIEEHAGHILRPVFMRPGLMYHPHNRPWSTIPATMIDLSYNLHKMHRRWKVPIPSPADILRSSFIPAAFHPLSGALTTPALHVDTVATAICESISRPEVRGAQLSESIRQLAGWPAETDAA